MAAPQRSGSGPPRWQIGSVTVSRIDEGARPMPIAGLIDAATSEAMAPYRGSFSPEQLSGPDDTMLLNVAGFVIESGGRRILVDTCIGSEFRPGSESAFLANLAAAGYASKSIDAVICTHAHFDHVGCNTVLEGDVRRPSFPRARYLFTDTEWESVSDLAPETTGLFGSVDRQVRFVVDAGVADLVDTSHRLTDSVSLLPTPGHSPGHVCVVIESRGARGIISGDAIHHPVQLNELKWGAADADPRLATESRSRLIELVADTDTLLIGSHFATPTAGHVVTGKEGVRFVGAPTIDSGGPQ